MLLWILAGEGNNHFLSSFDEQHSQMSSRHDNVTGFCRQIWGPLLYENCNAAPWWQDNLRSIWRKKGKWHELDDQVSPPAVVLPPTGFREDAFSDPLLSQTPLSLPSWAEKGQEVKWQCWPSWGQRTRTQLAGHWHLSFVWIIYFLKLKSHYSTSQISWIVCFQTLTCAVLSNNQRHYHIPSQ